MGAYLSQDMSPLDNFRALVNQGATNTEAYSTAKKTLSDLYNRYDKTKQSCNRWLITTIALTALSLVAALFIGFKKTALMVVLTLGSSVLFLRRRQAMKAESAEIILLSDQEAKEIGVKAQIISLIVAELQRCNNPLPLVQYLQRTSGDERKAAENRQTGSQPLPDATRAKYASLAKSYHAKAKGVEITDRERGQPLSKDALTLYSSSFEPYIIPFLEPPLQNNQLDVIADASGHFGVRRAGEGTV